MILFRRFPGQLLGLVWRLIVFFVLGLSTALAAPAISQLIFNSATHTLQVEGTAKNGPVSVYDAVTDQLLAIQALIDGKFTVRVNNLSVAPYRIRIVVGNEIIETLSQVSASTAGDIMPRPIDSQALQLNQELHFDEQHDEVGQ